MTVRILLVVLGTVIGLQAQAAGDSITVVDRGKAACVIAVATGAIPAEVTASRELQTYIKKSTGADLPVVEERLLEPGRPAILLGQTQAAKEMGLVPEGPEQWVIRSVGNRLVLTGGRPRGVLYAVYHFLEDQVGVRWWTLWDETVPLHKKLVFRNIDSKGQPAFAYRDIFDGLIPWPKEFYARNRVNGEFTSLPADYGGTITYGPPSHVHTFNRYFPPDQHYAQHPDWYALNDGKRNPYGQLCLTNPELINAWVEKMKNYIETSYADADSRGVARPVYFSISQNDFLGNCECVQCKQVEDADNAAGLSMKFVNEVSSRIALQYPEVMVDTLGYWYYQEAPKRVKPRDNVRVRLCDSGEDVVHSIVHKNNAEGLRRLADWSKITKHLAVWKYGVVYSPNLPVPSMLGYADDVRMYKKYGVEGVFLEIENAMTTDMWDMKIWMAAKLYENPDLDSARLVKEFTDGFYGSAGKYIRQYLDTVQKAAEKKPSYINFGGGTRDYSYMTLDVVRKCNEIFDKAEEAVAGKPSLLDRVVFARASLDRTICFRYGELYKEYRSRKYAGNYELYINKSAERASAIIRKVAGMRFSGRRESAQHAYDQALVLDRFKVLKIPASIPRRFAKLPVDDVYDFSPKDFRLVNEPVLVDDPEAAYGVAAAIEVSKTGANAARYIVSEDNPMFMGQYNSIDKVSLQDLSIRPSDIRPGYNLYKLGPTTFRPSEYFYLLWNWLIQLDLTPVISENPDQLYEVYASIKFDGPSMPSGNPKHPDAIMVDRILVIKVKK